MVIDYKDVSFSFKDRRKKKHIQRVRLIAIALVLLIIIVAIMNWRDSGRMNSVQDLLLEANISEASQRFQTLESAWFHGDSKKELKGLVLLFNKEFKQAQTYFQELGTDATSIRYKEFLTYFSQKGMYRELDIYNSYLLKKLEGTADYPPLTFYKVLTRTAALDYQNAAKLAGTLAEDVKEENKQELALLKKVQHQIKNGTLTTIFDVNGKPLGSYDLSTKNIQSLAPGIRFDEFAADFQKNAALYGLTLDLDLQERLDHLFRNQFGSFILFNVADSSIAAAYSKPIGQASKEYKNAVFQELYEPGSIIKLITLLAYLQTPSGSNQLSLFPFQCKGSWPLEGKIFYDWLTHDIVETPDQALAVSCNLAFAHMGAQIGYKNLKAMLDRFFFDSTGFNDLFLSFATGQTNKSVAGGFQLANLSVGLEEVSISTFHAGLLSLIISQNGSVYKPYMIKNKKNLYNIAYYNHKKELLKVLENNTAFFKCRNAMVYVIEAPDGTGRRARVDGMQAAAKTGTSGNKKLGLDSVITGFFPAAKPQYAFAFRLQRAGKAEWEGARFLKRFLTMFNSIQPGGKKP